MLEMGWISCVGDKMDEWFIGQMFHWPRVEYVNKGLIHKPANSLFEYD